MGKIRDMVVNRPPQVDRSRLEETSLKISDKLGHSTQQIQGLSRRCGGESRMQDSLPLLDTLAAYPLQASLSESAEHSRETRAKEGHSVVAPGGKEMTRQPHSQMVQERPDPGNGASQIIQENTQNIRQASQRSSQSAILHQGRSYTSSENILQQYISGGKSPLPEPTVRPEPEIPMRSLGAELQEFMQNFQQVAAQITETLRTFKIPATTEHLASWEQGRDGHDTGVSL